MKVDENLITNLPDPLAARRFLLDLEQTGRKNIEFLERNRGLLSDLLTLASYSPLLATTLIQHPEHIHWLARRRADQGGRTKAELLESLARFTLTNSQLDIQVLLARFRRRELLRIFLRDIRRLSTIAEITEELSNLADAILEHALRVARQLLENRYGVPLEVDAAGRSKPAGFAIVSLGKLGSWELNYASDVDLLFIYSSDGETSATGTKGAISNREFSIKLSQEIIKIVGEQSGEGAAYRVDLRLRPHGSIGPLSMSLKDTIRYYQRDARGWELQAMIRSRTSAGNPEVFSQFYAAIESRIYSIVDSKEDTLAKVRTSKDQIDLGLTDGKRFNVKLGRGGIREIEFIAQGLQLAYGGDDKWLRSTHTLISLSRIADRGLLTSKELTELFDAYDFLRRLEHILQMEHGLQTHSVPDEPDRRRTIASKLNDGPVDGFETRLATHTSNVNRIFNRIFPSVGATPADLIPTNRELRKLKSNSIEARTNRVSGGQRETLDQLAAIAPRFADLALSDPDLLEALPNSSDEPTPVDWVHELSGAADPQFDFRRSLADLRKIWHRQILRLASFDVLKQLPLDDVKEGQTRLAEACIHAAFLITSRELSRRLKLPEVPLRMAALALGKLAGRGLDYDSDLDLLLTFEDLEPLFPGEVTNPEFYSRAAELFVTALSSVTREGSLYRVDLRLRPHGKNGPNSLSEAALIDYMRREAAIWELLAYSKLRAAGGDAGLGSSVETTIRGIVHERARSIAPRDLSNAVVDVRDRLEKQRAGQLKAGAIDIKYGVGGLLDIYFATRFLQLRDAVQDSGDRRSTQTTLRNLRDAGSISAADHTAFSDGHKFLSKVDHSIRLSVGRSTKIPFANDLAMRNICSETKCSSVVEFTELVRTHLSRIREAFDRILRVD